MWNKFKTYFYNKKQHSQPQPLPSCQICLSTLSLNNTTKLCNCQHIYCTQCVNQFIHTKIQNYQLIKCLDQNCNSQLNENSSFYIQLHIQKKLKYQKIKRFYFVSKNPQFKLCPKQNCPGMVNIKLIGKCCCDVCLQKYCPKCLYKQHWGKCQKQSILHLQNDLKFIQCSHCNFIIQKNDGCDHIKCRCGYQFCYKCGGIWKGPSHLCVRSKPVQKIRQYWLNSVTKIRLLYDNFFINKIRSESFKILGNIFYFDLILTVIIISCNILYSIISMLIPYQWICEKLGFSQQNDMQTVQEVQQSGSSYWFIFVCVLIGIGAFYLSTFIQINRDKRKYLSLIGVLIGIGVYYFVSTFFLVLHYEWLIIWFVLQNILIIIGVIVLIGVGLYYLSQRQFRLTSNTLMSINMSFMRMFRDRKRQRILYD